MKNCLHFNDIIDHREGTIICIDCGIVKDNYYENKIISAENEIGSNSLGEIENILDQLHMPEELSSIITGNLQMSNKRSSDKSKDNLSNIDHKHVSLKKLVSFIYNTANHKKSNVLLKDISNFSNLEPKKIKSKDIYVVNMSEILEKYTKRFKLNYKNYLEIEKKVTQFNNTGYQPLTIIGGVIYFYHIEKNKKISMRIISSILGISSISIQRFIKKNQNAFPPRCRIAKR